MMKRIEGRPDYAVVVRDFAQLDRIARTFADGDLNLLILVGAPGLQKSRVMQQAIGDKAFWVHGNATAFRIYIDLYHHRGQPVVIDDLDSAFADRQVVRMLKSLCQTEPTKTVGWNSDAATLDREGIPRRFETTSRVAVIANTWATINANVAALEDRGLVLSFEPTAEEVHRRTADWLDAGHQEIFDFIGDRLHLIVRPSMRHYVLGAQLKQAGLDWRALLLGRWLTGTAALAAEIQADTSFPTEEARARAFIDRGGGCRATYFNHTRKLRPPSEPLRITLRHRAPDPRQPAPSGLDELLRRRHGRLGEG